MSLFGARRLSAAAISNSWPVLGLFLGLERGVICLLTACVLSVAYVFGREIGRRVMGRGAPRSQHGASGSADHAGTGVPSVSEPFLSGAIREVTTEHDRDSLLAGTMPFAPFIALGTLVASWRKLSQKSRLLGSLTQNPA